MSEGMNRVTLFGNLAADPELKATSGGQSVMKMRIACNERYQDKSGAWQDRTEFVSVTVWGKRAESLHRFLQKGSCVLVEGSLHTSSYEKNGEKRYSTEVNAKTVLLAGRGGNGESTGERRQQSKPTSESRPQPAPSGDAPPDDMPF